MKTNLDEVLTKVCKVDLNVIHEKDKTIFELGENARYGTMESYTIFPGVILAFTDIKVKNPSDVFFENIEKGRLLEINHCSDGRYAFEINEDKLIYFGNGDLCASVYNLNKSISDFPLGYYKGLEFFIDVDVANNHVRKYLPDFDLVEFYKDLEENDGYVFLKSNDQINHVIGELYDVDERIRNSYFKIKTIELLLFLSIAKFNRNINSISFNHVEIVENVKNDLISNLDKKLTIDELAAEYNVSKTTLKNIFKEVNEKPIYQWIKEYKLNHARKLILETDYSIFEISQLVGYSSVSKFSHAFKQHFGRTPSEYRK